MKIQNKLYLSVLTTLLTIHSLQASSDSNIKQKHNATIFPYAFSSDATGLAGGIAFIKQGLFQPHTTLVASLFGGLKEVIQLKHKEEEAHFKGAFLAFSNYKIPYTQRVFLSLLALKSYFPKQKYYFDGRNNSQKQKDFTTSGKSNFVNTTFEYILPIGEGLANPEGTYSLKNGFAQNREGYGNGTPFLTGRTTIGLKTFYQEDSFENWTAFELWKNESPTSTPVWNTNGLRLFLTHDNTDFNLNPSRGYYFEFQYSKDFGKGDSLQSWDFLEFKFNKYYTLDTFSFSKQNVLAMSLWTGYSFSWDKEKQIAAGIDAHRPPTWEGARLGGLNRMRGYEMNRFSDKAVFYATAEYRTTLNYNPFKKNDLIPVAVDWLQVVAFIEVGRVHNQYNFELFNDLKYDVGISLRAMVAQLPIRFDVAYGEEGTNMWVMIQHPFDY